MISDKGAPSGRNKIAIHIRILYFSVDNNGYGWLTILQVFTFKETRQSIDSHTSPLPLGKNPRFLHLGIQLANCFPLLKRKVCNPF